MGERATGKALTRAAVAAATRRDQGRLFPPSNIAAIPFPSPPLVPSILYSSSFPFPLIPLFLLYASFDVDLLLRRGKGREGEETG